MSLRLHAMHALREHNFMSLLAHAMQHLHLLMLCMLKLLCNSPGSGAIRLVNFTIRHTHQAIPSTPFWITDCSNETLSVIAIADTGTHIWHCMVWQWQ